MNKVTQFVSTLVESFGGFVLGQVKDALCQGVLCGLGMYLLELPHAAVVAVLVGLLALIPVAGPLLGGLLGTVIMLLTAPKRALAFLIMFLLLQLLDEYIIYPKVVGKAVGLPGIWVLLIVVVGGALFGVWGLLLGVPLAAAIYKVLHPAKAEAVAEEPAQAK